MELLYFTYQFTAWSLESGLFDKSILPYHRSHAPYTRGFEYLLKQSGSEPHPLLNETEEAEGKELNFLVH